MNQVAAAALLALALALTLSWWVWRMGNRISQLSREKERLAFERKFALHNLSASRGSVNKEELLTGMESTSTWPAPKKKELLETKLSGGAAKSQQRPVGSSYAPSSVDPMSDGEDVVGLTRFDPKPQVAPAHRASSLLFAPMPSERCPSCRHALAPFPC